MGAGLGKDLISGLEKEVSADGAVEFRPQSPQSNPAEVLAPYGVVKGLNPAAKGFSLSSRVTGQDGGVRGSIVKDGGLSRHDCLFTELEGDCLPFHGSGPFGQARADRVVQVEVRERIVGVKCIHREAGGWIPWPQSLNVFWATRCKPLKPQ